MLQEADPGGKVALDLSEVTLLQLVSLELNRPTDAPQCAFLTSAACDQGHSAKAAI